MCNESVDNRHNNSNIDCNTTGNHIWKKQNLRYHRYNPNILGRQIVAKVFLYIHAIDKLYFLSLVKKLGDLILKNYFTILERAHRKHTSTLCTESNSCMDSSNNYMDLKRSYYSSSDGERMYCGIVDCSSSNDRTNNRHAAIIWHERTIWIC